MEYFDEIRLALNSYSGNVLPLIEENEYLTAGFELGNIVSLISDNWWKIPHPQLKVHTFGLLSRLELLKERCLEEDGRGIVWAKKSVEEGLDPLQSAEALTKGIREIGEGFNKGEWVSSWAELNITYKSGEMVVE